MRSAYVQYRYVVSKPGSSQCYIVVRKRKASARDTTFALGLKLSLLGYLVQGLSASPYLTDAVGLDEHAQGTSVLLQEQILLLLSCEARYTQIRLFLLAKPKPIVLSEYVHAIVLR